ETYLTCLSEHRAEEDTCGRLSMWRAYGGTTGVAVVLNGDVMFAESNALGIYSSPVNYYTEKQFNNNLAAIADAMAKNREFIIAAGKPAMMNMIFMFFLFSVICTKHPGFEEELEWRVVCSPALRGPTNRVRSSVEVVRGIPQLVYKIP